MARHAFACLQTENSWQSQGVCPLCSNQPCRLLAHPLSPSLSALLMTPTAPPSGSWTLPLAPNYTNSQAMPATFSALLLQATRYAPSITCEPMLQQPPYAPCPHSASWSPALMTGILASGTRHTRVTARCRGRAWLCVAVGQCHCRLRPAPRICMCWRCWTRARRACGGARSPPAASPASTDPASPRASFAPRARAPLAAHNPTSEQHRCSWTLAVAAAAARCASWRKALVSLSSTTYGTLVKTGNGAPRWPWTLQWKRVVRWRSRLQAKHLGR